MEAQQIEMEPRQEERSELNQIIDVYLNNDDDSSGSEVESSYLKDIEVEQATDVSVEGNINEDGNTGETTDETQSNEREMDLLKNRLLKQVTQSKIDVDPPVEEDSKIVAVKNHWS